MDGRHGGDPAFQDSVDVFERAAADHREATVQRVQQRGQEFGPAVIWPHILRSRRQGRQGAIKIQEQGGAGHVERSRRRKLR
jgi:hypothetical protein